MKNIKHIAPIIMMGFLCVMYPIWWISGSLDSIALKVAVFIPCYGGFLAHLVWYLQNRKNL